MSGKIFISYGRQESRWSARSLYDHLIKRFDRKQVFMDIDAIAAGHDFLRAIEETILSCDVVIAVIDKCWATSSDEEGRRRLDNPDYIVRKEIATALTGHVRIIPVIVDGASMPRSSELPDDLKLLARRNALMLRDDHFNEDVGRLVGTLELILEHTDEERRQREQKERVEAQCRDEERKRQKKAVIDVFISYAREDKPCAVLIAQALERKGLSVWWDRNVPPGKSYDRMIGEALDSAKCIMVLWSQQSVASDWVKDEAEEGNRRGVLVPASIEEVRVPLGFRRLQTANLVGWKGDDDHPEFQDVVSAIKSHLNKQGEENEQLGAVKREQPSQGSGNWLKELQKRMAEEKGPTPIGDEILREEEQAAKARLEVKQQQKEVVPPVLESTPFGESGASSPPPGDLTIAPNLSPAKPKWLIVVALTLITGVGGLWFAVKKERAVPPAASIVTPTPMLTPPPTTTESSSDVSTVTPEVKAGDIVLQRNNSQQEYQQYGRVDRVYDKYKSVGVRRLDDVFVPIPFDEFFRSGKYQLERGSRKFILSPPEGVPTSTPEVKAGDIVLQRNNSQQEYQQYGSVDRVYDEYKSVGVRRSDGVFVPIPFDEFFKSGKYQVKHVERQ
jgi:hypothetical protein